MIYIAGPMTGVPQHNIPAFQEAAERLRKLGYPIITPVELDEPEVVQQALADPTGFDDKGYLSKRGAFLGRDVQCLLEKCDAIALLPEWETSLGAMTEVCTGIIHGFDIFLINEDGLQPMRPQYIMEKVNASIF